MKKHSSLLYSNKKDMEDKSPADFCEYLRKNIRHTFKGGGERLLPEKKSNKENFSFDKYIAWSPKAFRILKDKIKEEEGKRKVIPLTKHSKKVEANIRTFLYKYPI